VAKVAPRPAASEELAPAPTLVGPAPSRRRPTLDEVQLARAVPGARRSEEIPATEGSAAYEIPLGDEDIEIVDAAPSAAEAARSIFPRTPLFSALDEEHLRALIERVELRHLAAGETLFSRGDPADALFVVASGAVGVLLPGPDGEDVEVTRLGEGAFFGEVALLAEQPRSATIRAVADTELIAVARSVISEVIADSPELLQVLLRFLRDRLVEGLIETDPLFAPFSGAERRSLAARFRFLEIEPGLPIVRQGNRASGLFIVLCGAADVVVDGDRVGEVGSGGLVGQASLLTGAASPSSLVARSKVLALELPRAAFQEVIMTHPQVLEYIGGFADDRGGEQLRRGAFVDGRLRVV
jgi:CRP-like cAMP-binding protein